MLKNEGVNCVSGQRTVDTGSWEREGLENRARVSEALSQGPVPRGRLEG